MVRIGIFLSQLQSADFAHACFQEPFISGVLMWYISEIVVTYPSSEHRVHLVLNAVVILNAFIVSIDVVLKKNKISIMLPTVAELEFTSTPICDNVKDTLSLPILYISTHIRLASRQSCTLASYSTSGMSAMKNVLRIAGSN